VSTQPRGLRMSTPFGMADLREGQVRDRRERLADFLDAWGDLRVRDLGGDRDRRLLGFSLEAPGRDLPVEVRARYSEYYRRHRGGWRLAKYHYEYLDIAWARRLAYHLHGLGSRPLVPHAHCEDAAVLSSDEGTHHLRAVPLDLREAHMQFMRLYASDSPPDCSAFLPLEIRRDI
jgi:hypothetical protein